jgi:hypothetical protein
VKVRKRGSEGKKKRSRFYVTLFVFFYAAFFSSMYIPRFFPVSLSLINCFLWPFNINTYMNHPPPLIQSASPLLILAATAAAAAAAAAATASASADAATACGRTRQKLAQPLPIRRRGLSRFLFILSRRRFIAQFRPSLRDATC